MSALLIGAGAFAALYLYASFFEWTMHRYVMHRPFMNFFRYPFRTHAQTHHVVFRHDDTYHLSRQEDEDVVAFAWWNAPVLIGSHMALLAGLANLAGGWPLFVGGSLGITAYYACYEYFHWCMHVPKNRWFERTRLFQGINLHHRLHHFRQGTNFNVVLPLADLLLGTLLRARDVPSFDGRSA